MFQKHNRYYADWWDERRVRRRRAFVTLEEAMAHERKEKAAVLASRKSTREIRGRLSHYDEAGRARMVDVSAKAETRREAVAEAFVELSEAVLGALPGNPKGNPLEVARFAGIQAAKRTSELIPMCHALALSFVDVEAAVVAGGVRVRATAATVAGTGVEMEAMVAASVAALTVYDMTKALDKGIRIREVALVSKSGGKSGEWRR
jgi:cyclic pyranopterin monophosphate synthase